MANIKRRLEALERGAEGRPAEEVWASDEIHISLREDAERSIERSLREGREPVFQIARDGSVHTSDGWAVTGHHQILAEEFYQWELEWYRVGCSELVFDADAEAFYTPEGGLALSRTYVSLPRLMGGGVYR